MLNVQQNNLEEARSKFKRIIKLCHKVAQNEARDTVNYLLDQVYL